MRQISIVGEVKLPSSCKQFPARGQVWLADNNESNKTPLFPFHIAFGWTYFRRHIAGWSAASLSTEVIYTGDNSISTIFSNKVYSEWSPRQRISITRSPKFHKAVLELSPVTFITITRDSTQSTLTSTLSKHSRWWEGCNVYHSSLPPSKNQCYSQSESVNGGKRQRVTLF